MERRGKTGNFPLFFIMNTIRNLDKYTPREEALRKCNSLLSNANFNFYLSAVERKFITDLNVTLDHDFYYEVTIEQMRQVRQIYRNFCQMRSFR